MFSNTKHVTLTLGINEWSWSSSRQSSMHSAQQWPLLNPYHESIAGLGLTGWSKKLDMAVMFNFIKVHCILEQERDHDSSLTTNTHICLCVLPLLPYSLCGRGRIEWHTVAKVEECCHSIPCTALKMIHRGQEPLDREHPDLYYFYFHDERRSTAVLWICGWSPLKGISATHIEMLIHSESFSSWGMWYTTTVYTY